jgi:hypothetical protein
MDNINLNDDYFASFLHEMIKKEVQTQLKKEMKHSGYIKAWVATVVNVDSLNNTADVKLPGDNINILISKSNNTGKTLNIGDKVYLHSSGSLSSSYIAIKI